MSDFENKVFAWDFSILRRFYDKYIVKWLNSAMGWTEEQKAQARENLGVEDILRKLKSDVSGIYNGFYFDGGHLYSLNGDDSEYKKSDDYSCAWVVVRNSTKIYFTGAIATRVIFFSSESLSHSDYISNIESPSGEINIPPGAVLAIFNFRNDANSDYSELSITQDNSFARLNEVKSQVSSLETRIVKPSDRFNAQGFYVDYNHRYNYDTDPISYIDSTTYDNIQFAIPSGATKVEVRGAVSALIDGRHNYLFFSDAGDMEGGSHYIGRNKTGDVITGTNWCVVSLKKDLNPSYDGISIHFDNDYAKQPDLDLVTAALTHDSLEVLSAYSIDTNYYYKSDGSRVSSNNYSARKYQVDASKKYFFSGYLKAGITTCMVAFLDSEDATQAISVAYKGSQTQESVYEDEELTLPEGTTYIALQPRVGTENRFVLKVQNRELMNLEDVRTDILSRMNKTMKVIINEDNTAYVRSHFDESQDVIMTFGFNDTRWENNHASLQPHELYLGDNTLSDEELISQGRKHDIHDTVGPVTTSEFGPMWANHGYCIPKITVSAQTLTSADIGSEWKDTNTGSDRHYTIGKIDGNDIYLLPVIYNKETPGSEYRQWEYYGSPEPSGQLTHVSGATHTAPLTITGYERWDLQVSECTNIQYIADGVRIGKGEYYCNELVLNYTQIGYNPIKVNTWWPRPVYNGIFAQFERQFTVSADEGFLSLTNNQVWNNLYPFVINRFLNTAPMFNFGDSDYDSYIFIPKMKKVYAGSGSDAAIDFREEFVSNDKNHNTISYYRNSDDLYDRDDMPDRAYNYLKSKTDNSILFGVAGGHSLVSGQSMKSVRNQFISYDSLIGWWNPGVGNKFYASIMRKGDDGVNVTTDFITSAEGYLCWYKPQNNTHCFYHKTADGYVVYIHTNNAHVKGIAELPKWMNGMAVTDTIEASNADGNDRIELLTTRVVNGRLYFKSGSGYQYLVIKVK